MHLRLENDDTITTYPKLTLSDLGLRCLKQFEGCKLSAYLDVAGIPTIGYGRIEGVRLNQVITQEQADQYLRDDVKRFEAAVLTKAPGLTQCQFDALVCFTYNVGIGAFGKSTLLRLVRANPYDTGIRAQFLRWNKAGGKVVTGLTRRREEEANLYEGLYDTDQPKSSTLKRSEPLVKL